MKRISWFTPKNRILLIIISVVAICVVYFLPQGEQTVKLSPPAVNMAVSATPTMPKGHKPSQLRDPFSIASVSPVPVAGLQQSLTLPALPNKQDRTGRQKTTSATALPVLSGIVSGSRTKMAIIDYHGSQSYAVDDKVGKWVVTAINDEFVILEGPNGQQTLWLGR